MEPDMHTLAFIQNIGIWEWLIIGTLGLLLFGKRLPEVGRNLGKGIVEFKRGLKEVDTDIESQSNRPAPATTSGHTSTLPPASVTAPPAQAEQRVSRGDQP